MGFSEDITGEEQTGEARFECGRTLKVKRSGDKSRSFLWTDSFHVSVKVDGPYFPYFPYFPSLAAAAWHSLAAASAAVVVFELPFARSAAVFAAAVVVVFGFAAGVARSLFVDPFFAAAVAAAVAAGAASLAAALLADRPWVALPTDVRSADGWLDDSHLDWAHSEYWQPVGDSGLLSPQAGSVLVFLQADSGSASLLADLGRVHLPLVDLD
jgi:hypothetical protein